ncbi:MAG: helix-turn-helix domain-containing protein [Bacteroidia bacterium]
MPFYIIQYLLTSVFIVAIINIFLIYKLKERTVFNVLLLYYNIYVACHAFYVSLVEEIFTSQTALDRYAPFGLMYGPFLYFAFIAISNREIPLTKVVLHCSPFVVFAIGSIYIAFQGEFSSFAFTYYKVLNFVSVASFICYTVLALFLKVEPIDVQFRQRKLIILTAIIILLFVSVVSIAAIFSTQAIIAKPTAIVLLRNMVYSCILITTIMVFKYKINIIFFKISNAHEFINQGDGDILKVSVDQAAKYEKSTLSNKQLEEYCQKLEKLMLSQRAYLITDLSLQKLAQLLRIPNHHLTQVLSLKVRMSFYDYVNGFRVQHACMLLDENPRANLEGIAERSGFNSKVSFNRHFKSTLGCTPSEYRSQKHNAVEL